MKVSLTPKPDMSGWEKLKQLKAKLYAHKQKVIRLDKQFRKYCPNCSDIKTHQDGCTVAIEAFNPVWLVERRRHVDNGLFWACPKCSYIEKPVYNFDSSFDNNWDD